VLTAMVERQPGRSATFAYVRQHYRQRLGGRVIDACGERCTHLGRTRSWHLQIADCLNADGCSAFARCAAPVLEP
jgi:hypothetical protein